MALLENDEIEAALAADLAGWTREGDAMVRAVEAPDFLTGIDLVRRVAEAAETAQHHPDIDIRWTTITFRLSTHSEGGVTAADLELARAIDALAAA